jgi:hypothetical protein
MSWNFALNNSLTFRDRRLSGPALWRGLLSFYAACLGGALASEAAGAGLADRRRAVAAWRAWPARCWARSGTIRPRAA